MVALYFFAFQFALAIEEIKVDYFLKYGKVFILESI